MTRSPSGRSGQATVLGGMKVRRGSSNSNCDFSEKVLTTRTVCKKLATGAKDRIMWRVLFSWCVGCDDAQKYWRECYSLWPNTPNSLVSEFGVIKR